jgi:hypothetical protein
MERHLLSKSTFIRGNQCLKSLYLNKHRPFLRDKLDPETLKRFKRGHQFGSLAQQLFPGGVDLSPKSHYQYQKAVATTAEVIRTNSYPILYEAGFQFDRLLVFLDILQKEQGDWVAYEVKSSYRISDTFILDAAFQYYVISNSGLPLKDFFIVHASEQVDDEKLQHSDDLSPLFVRESVLERLLPLQPGIREQVKIQKQTLAMAHAPDIAMGPQCQLPYPCDFIGFCTNMKAQK